MSYKDDWKWGAHKFPSATCTPKQLLIFEIQDHLYWHPNTNSLGVGEEAILICSQGQASSGSSGSDGEEGKGQGAQSWLSTLRPESHSCSLNGTVVPNVCSSLVIIGKCFTLMYLVTRMARLVASTRGQTATTPWGEYSWDGRRLWKNEAAATQQQKSCYAILDYHWDDTNLLTANAYRRTFVRIFASGFNQCLLLHRTLW